MYFLLSDGGSPRLVKKTEVELAIKPLHPTSIGNTFVIQPFLTHCSRRSSYFSNLRLCAQSKFSSKGTVNSIYYKLNYHDQKISVRDIRKHWTAVFTLFGLISGDLLNWRSNQRPQNAERKLYHWATGLHRTQALPYQLVIVNVRSLNLKCLVVTFVLLQRTQSPPELRLPKLETLICVIIPSWARK